MVELDPEGESLWIAVRGGWDEPARHDRFVQWCFARGLLAAAGARYAGYLAEHPGDGMASTMRERVVFLSMQALVSASPRPVRWTFLQSPRFLLLLLVGAALGAALGIIYGARP